MVRQQPKPTLFPYTTLFRSLIGVRAQPRAIDADGGGELCRGGTQARPRKDAEPAVVCEPCRNQVLARSEEHTSELQSLAYLVCRLLLEKKKRNIRTTNIIHR